MPETTTLSSVMDAAEAAAGAGDFQLAGQHLRQAVALQEATLGAQHPDVASTLNNLGVVYEHLNQPAEAERCYRRAYAVASASLPPDDASVVLSAKNLRDFCEARGIPFEAPTAPVAPAPPPPGQNAEASRAPAPAATTPPRAVAQPVTPVRPSAPLASSPSAAASSPRPATPPPAPARPAPRPPAPPVVAAPAPLSPSGPASSRSTVVWALIGLAAIVAVVMFLQRPRTAPPATTAAREPVAAPPASVPPPSAPAPGAPATAPSSAADPSASPAAPENPPPAVAAAPAPEPKPEPAPAQTPDAAPTGRSASAKPAVAPDVVTAQVCRALDTAAEWRCTPVTGSLEPGPVYFYTRLKTRSDMTVEHRWYLNDRLRQTMTLHIHANQDRGYRTYSRTTVSPAGAGDWRVELRTTDGTVLHEERFTVGRP